MPTIHNNSFTLTLYAKEGGRALFPSYTFTYDSYPSIAVGHLIECGDIGDIGDGEVIDKGQYRVVSVTHCIKAGQVYARVEKIEDSSEFIELQQGSRNRP